MPTPSASASRSFIERAIERWSRHPTIEILGNPALDRLSIVLVRRPLRRIRTAAGAISTTTTSSRCSTTCSASSRVAAARAPVPYGHRLLGIDLERSHEFEREIARGCEGIKPGWVRVNFNYFISEAVFDFILSAVELVATDGWRLLPLYRFEPATGLWSHAGGAAEPPLSLHDVEFGADGMRWPSHRHTEPESRLADYLDEARRILAAPPRPVVPPDAIVDSDDFESLRWFPLPSEIDRPWLSPPIPIGCAPSSRAWAGSSPLVGWRSCACMGRSAVGHGRPSSSSSSVVFVSRSASRRSSSTSTRPVVPRPRRTTCSWPSNGSLRRSP